MKNIFKNFLFVITLTGLFASCKKDEDKAVLQTGTTPVLTASASSLVLTSATAADTIQTISWSASSYGYKAAVTYTLQFAKAGTSFANVEEISQTTLNKKYTGSELNQLAVRLGLAFNTAAQIDVRVRASVNNTIAPVTSNVVTITLTPYQVIVNYPSLYVPGDYWTPTWTPDQSPRISSKTNNGTYEGYINFPNASSNFKFTSDPDWNHTNYGSGATATTLSTSGSAGNLTIAGAGYYRVIANTPALTWSSTKVTYGLIGNAPVASNNWSVDVPMTYNATAQTWTVTTNMVAGEFKFRANSDWNNPMNNFGDTTPADGVPDYNGSNLAITSAGNYTITLDLHIPGNYTYTVRKN